ncbi:hypothetical protein AMTRI_Chr05g71190 [Amborella trichopoda]
MEKGKGKKGEKRKKKEIEEKREWGNKPDKLTRFLTSSLPFPLLTSLSSYLCKSTISHLDFPLFSSSSIPQLYHLCLHPSASPLHTPSDTPSPFPFFFSSSYPLWHSSFLFPTAA